MNRIFQIGFLPPPVGGVSIKNKILKEMFEEAYQVNFFNFKLMSKHKDRNAFEKASMLINLISFIWKNKSFKGVICLSNKQLSITLRVIKLVAGRCRQNTVIFVAGGVFDRYLLANKDICDETKKYRKIYVESRSMEDTLIDMGFENVRFLPNFRKMNEYVEKRERGNKLKAIFASRICEEKGIFEILNSGIDKDKYEVDFMGHSEQRQKEILGDD